MNMKHAQQPEEAVVKETHPSVTAEERLESGQAAEQKAGETVDRHLQGFARLA